MYADGGVKASCRKNAEALDNAEVFGRKRSGIFSGLRNYAMDKSLPM